MDLVGWGPDGPRRCLLFTFLNRASNRTAARVPTALQGSLAARLQGMGPVAKNHAQSAEGIPFSFESVNNALEEGKQSVLPDHFRIQMQKNSDQPTGIS